MRPKIILARGIALAWLGWWTFFAFASDIIGDGGWGAVGRLSFLVFVLGGGVGAAWRWPRAGGALLIAIGCALAGLVAGPLYTTPYNLAFLLLTLALPPIAAGALQWQATRPLPSM